MDLAVALNLKVLLQALIVSTVTFTVISAVVYLNAQHRGYRNLLYFWLGNCFHLLLAYLVRSDDLRIVALGMLSMWWRIPILRLIMEDLTGETLYRRWHYPVMALGYALSGVLMWQGTSFMIYTLPTSLAVFVVGMSPILRSFKILHEKEHTTMHMVQLVVFTLLMLHKLDYSFLRPLPEFASLGYYFTLVLNVMTGALLPGIILSTIQRSHTSQLEKLVEERSKQLMVVAPSTAVGSLASGVAHEINNPLGIITAWTTALMRSVKEGKSTPAELLHGLDKINVTAFRIGKIVRSLKDFSDSDKNSEPPQVVVMDEIVEDALTFCRDRFQNYHVELRLRLQSGLQIQARSVEISQALLYVLLNACDAVKDLPERWVELRMLAVGDKIRLIVIDSGRGISEEVVARMMDPFFTTKPLGEGTGMGLAMAKGIIEAHRGRIFYDGSQLNTTFTLEFPKI